MDQDLQSTRTNQLRTEHPSCLYPSLPRMYARNLGVLAVSCSKLILTHHLDHQREKVPKSYPTLQICSTVLSTMLSRYPRIDTLIHPEILSAPELVP